jgi:hypothetical protein
MCEKTCLAKQTLLSRVATLTYFFISTKEKQRRAERHILALKTELSEAYGVIVALSVDLNKREGYKLPDAIGLPCIQNEQTVTPTLYIFPDIYPTD